MTAAGFSHALRILCAQKPFQAFAIELNSGRRLSVHHPEAIALRTDVWVYVSMDGDYHFLDNASVCELVFSKPQASN